MPIRVTRSIVPNLFTLANLFCGFYSIIKFSENDFGTGCLLIGVAGVFDMLDGVVARAIHSTSELGVELDSLCDAVSFGVAPSFLLWKSFFYSYPDLGLLISSLPAMAGVYRLARFNIQVESFEDKKYFKGMPIPGGALTIVSFIYFYVIGNEIPTELKQIVVSFVTIAVSLAMVSTVKFDNAPRPSKTDLKERPFLFVFFVIGSVAAVLSNGKLLPVFLMIYLLSGLVRFLRQLYLQRTDLESEEFTEEDF